MKFVINKLASSTLTPEISRKIWLDEKFHFVVVYTKKLKPSKLYKQNSYLENILCKTLG